MYLICKNIMYIHSLLYAGTPAEKEGTTNEDGRKTVDRQIDITHTCAPMRNGLLTPYPVRLSESSVAAFPSGSISTASPMSSFERASSLHASWFAGERGGGLFDSRGVCMYEGGGRSEEQSPAVPLLLPLF